AAAIYLVNRDVGESHCQAAAQALAAARTTDDVELIARALFEYARSGAQSGDEDRVLAAKKEIDNLLEDDNARQVPILHTAQGFSTISCSTRGPLRHHWTWPEVFSPKARGSPNCLMSSTHTVVVGITCVTSRALVSRTSQD